MLSHFVRVEMESILTDFTFKQEQKRDQIRNHINNIKSKLPANILALKIGYLRELLEQSLSTYDQVQEQMNSNMGVLANITNQTLNTLNITASAKVSRTDDGKRCIKIHNFIHRMGLRLCLQVVAFGLCWTLFSFHFSMVVGSNATNMSFLFIFSSFYSK